MNSQIVDLDKLRELAKSLKNYLETNGGDKASRLRPVPYDTGLSLGQATIVGLYGDLGSGKTTFTQLLAKEYGIEDYVQSPTFLIEKKYTIDKSSHFKNLIHIDAYRLDSADEILNLDWQEIISNPENLIIVEWPERITEVLPQDILKIKFSHKDEEHRIIESDILDKI